MVMRFLSQRWLQVLVGGIILFVAAEQGLKLTGNLNLIPTVILVGAFVVPITFVSYFFSAERRMDRRFHPEISLPLVSTSFFVGGAVGVVAAGALEYSTLTAMSVGTLFGVATIEEAAKLIVPVIIFLFSRYRSQADGLLFGVATGMGFAALETMGYGMVAFIRSQGDIGALQEVLLVRGLLSPLGHAAWTGLVCSVLWGVRQRTGKSFGVTVLLAFVLAVLLHASWDMVGTVSSTAITYVGYAIIGGISLTLIIRQLSSARRLSLKQAPKPENGSPIAPD
jgi:RsiW-degrading membrane proteinase PrsW (M82 family)